MRQLLLCFFVSRRLGLSELERCQFVAQRFVTDVLYLASGLDVICGLFLLQRTLRQTQQPAS